MKGDFTRMTFDPKKHYRGVLMQQGRVQLDADWNEQFDIQAHRVENETRDVIGECGTPIDQQGFTLIVDAKALSAAEQTRLTKAKLLPLGLGDFLIGSGHYYVDGIIIENEDYLLYTQQPDYHGYDPKKKPRQPELEIQPIADKGLHLVYLDVWTRHITALDDESIREKALGGPDTATRAKTIWQVKIKKQLSDNITCAGVVVPGDESTGRLSARSKPLDDKKDECDVPPGAGYRRLENQLYRVEIHTGGKETASTFKWSRDNASMVTTWKSKSGNDLTVGSGGPDAVLGFAPNQWVELRDDTRELQGMPGTLVKLATAVGQKLTIDPATATGPIELSFFPRNRKVRRWDTIAASGGVRKVSDKDTVDGFIRLEDGVEVKFEKGEYRTGDYWLIPARTATADVEWPKDQSDDPIPQAKHGIHHHTCPLGLLDFDGTNLALQEDCRPFFPSLTELTCLYYVSGDGQQAGPKETLPYKLTVGVANGNHPVKGASIQWSVAGGGSLQNTQKVTDPQGRASSNWKLGSGGDQQVTAKLVTSAGQAVHLPVIFNAQFEQDGIDPGIHVEKIVFDNEIEFKNDREFPVDLLARGLRIVCDDRLSALSVSSQPTGKDSAVSPTVFVTLNLPYPLSETDRKLWGMGQVIAYQPLILAGNVTGEENIIAWQPAEMTRNWLGEVLFQRMQEIKAEQQRILAHLTLKGNFIWNEKADRYLDGDVFGVENKDSATGTLFVDAKLPSGDQRRGGDLEAWFWLVPRLQTGQPKPVVLLGNPSLEAFKPLSNQRLTAGLALAFHLDLDRTILRDSVPAEFEVRVDLQPDVSGAAKLVEKYKLDGLKFTMWSEALLFKTGNLISEMVKLLKIEMRVQKQAKLIEILPGAIDADKAPEAVLVDGTLTDQFQELGYTLEIVRL